MSSNPSGENGSNHRPPPGLSLHRNNNNIGSIPLQSGEMYEETRPLSAPPEQIDRSRIANEQIFWGNRGETNTTNDRNASFSNLAAVLGAGLAESMEEHERTQIDALFHAREFKDDINYARQTRHAASRLIGAEVQETNKATSLFSTSPFQRAGITHSRNNNKEPGFPSTLSSPERNHQEHTRSTTPVHLLPGQSGARRMMPSDRNIGMHVNEPEGTQFAGGVAGIKSQRMDQEMPERSLFSSDAKEFRPSENYNFDQLSTGAQSDLSESVTANTEMSSRQAENELRTFLWDIDRNKPSRTLAILHVSFLRVPDVRSACENFGAIESFRAEFANWGIFFVSFFDIRSAQYAAMELQAILQRLVVMQGSSEEVIVRYCLALNSSSQFDDSQIMISDLPEGIDARAIGTFLSSYGAVRSVESQGLEGYCVEFQNSQDAKQALLELESVQPWGPNVNVEVGLRDPSERKRGREMLAMISRWRKSTIAKPAVESAPRFPPANDSWRPNNHIPGVGAAQSDGPGIGTFDGAARQIQGQPERKFILGPDGRYTEVLVQGSTPYQSFPAQRVHAIDARPPQQQIIQGADGQIYVTTIPTQSGQSVSSHSHSFPASVISNAQYVDNFGHVHAHTPYYTHVVASDAASAYSGRSHHSGFSGRSTGTDRDNRGLLMDLDAVEEGRDTRTSLMVRNIPNKYTQQMLLAEFEENGHGPGVIDFFYLPIDFKNRCNRGYAFINFVNYKDILDFHRRYFGKHWRTFNSDKICDITYARIQGKAAMLKRFENSALMEKDDEYKPLVFVSDGPDKGKRLPFPDPSSGPV